MALLESVAAFSFLSTPLAVHCMHVLVIAATKTDNRVKRCFWARCVYYLSFTTNA
jgi:hypothetical protein